MDDIKISWIQYIKWLKLLILIIEIQLFIHSRKLFKMRLNVYNRKN